MPVNAAQSLAHTANLSYLPFHDGKKSRFTFWDAIQVSNALAEFSGLVYEKNLGEGVSFMVDLYRVEPAQPEVPALVAVKTAKISALLDGENSKNNNTDLYSLLLEIQVLCHEPIQQHPNIIKVLGIDWRRGTSQIPIPLLIVEYSKFGNLAGFLQSHDTIGIDVKVKLCLDIASGLLMIHECGVVHGDVKLTNILLFEDENGGLIAKIADFGCSITGFEQEEKLVYRGTQHYRAPELKHDPTLPISALQKCDVYAFGLCVWEILKNGKSYLEGLGASSAQPESDGSSSDFLLNKFDKFLDQMDVSDASISMTSDTFLEKPKPAKTAGDSMKAMICELVHRTIHPIPANRYLMSEVVKYISSNIAASSQTPTATLTALRFQRASVGIWNFSSSENRTPREAQCQAVVDLQDTYPTMEEQDKCQALMILSNCYAHGYGVAVDFQEALTYLQLAANGGSISAGAVLPRIAAAITNADKTSTLQDLDHSSALPGSVLETFRRVENHLSESPDGQSYHCRIREWVRVADEDTRRSAFSIFDEDGGVYEMQPCDEGQMAGIIKTRVKNPGTAVVLSHSKLQTSRQPLLPLIQFVTVNHSLELLQSLTKDTELLHLTISNEYSVSRNMSNFGNLLIAAAAHGHPTTLRYLLEQGVSPSRWTGALSVTSLVNPLHLLFLFEEGDLEQIAKLLVDHGADPNMSGAYSLSIQSVAADFPIELSGPPLDIAIAVGDSRSVRVLLALGADPLLRTGPTMVKQSHTCLELAVALHLHEIVEAILNHLSHEEQGLAIPEKEINNLLRNVSGFILGGKGMYWKWLLHGSEYRKNCERTIKTLLQYGISIDCIDEDGFSPIHVAANRNPCQNYVLEALLECGANPNCKGITGQVALHLCQGVVWDPEDNARTVRSLIKYGADVNIQDKDGDTPAHSHASANCVATLKCLVESGASLETRNSSTATPLHSAVTSGSYDTAKYLLDKGSDIESLTTKADPYRLTPLGWAVAVGRTRVVELLLSRGAKVYQQDLRATVLHFAVDPSRLATLRLLLRDYSEIFCKAEILNSMNNYENTPLQNAAACSLQCAHELLLAGADINFRSQDRWDSRTALAVSIEDGNYEITKFLLEKGASPFCRDRPERKMWSFVSEAIYWCGRKPAFRAKLPGLLHMTKPWIDRYNLFDVPDWGGRTMVQAAVFWGQFSALKAIVEMGAPVNRRCGRSTRQWEEDEWQSGYDYVGLSTLDFAKALRDGSPEQKAKWSDFVPFEITDNDMNDIIEYLGSLPDDSADVDEPIDEEDVTPQKKSMGRTSWFTKLLRRFRYTEALRPTGN